MLKKLLPKSADFSKYFEEHCDLVVASAQVLVDITEGKVSTSTGAERIRALEHKADSLTHECLVALQKTFITPFDRPQIHALIGRLDDIIDCINDAAIRLSLYEIASMRSEARELAAVIHLSAIALGEALPLLRDLSKEPALTEYFVRIHELENEGDDLLRKSLRALFKDELHPYLVIQWKEIFEFLEKASDRAEDVANVIQSIVLEAA